MIWRHALVVSAIAAAASASAAVVAGYGNRAAEGAALNGTAAPLLPDLRVFPAGCGQACVQEGAAPQLIVDTENGQKVLEFDMTSWNGGAGRFHLIGGVEDPDTLTQEVSQRVFNADGTWQD